MGYFSKFKIQKRLSRIMKRVQEINEAKNKRLKVPCATCGERDDAVEL